MSHDPDEHLITSEAKVSPERLIEAARIAYQYAYVPYSHYPVGAAVLADDDTIYTGVNVENAVYPLTMCAERTAIFRAISSGARGIRAVAVVTRNAGTPCGSCRQVMREFGQDTMPVYIADEQGHYRVRTLADLLPDSFSADDLMVRPDEH